MLSDGAQAQFRGLAWLQGQHQSELALVSRRDRGGTGLTESESSFELRASPPTSFPWAICVSATPHSSLRESHLSKRSPCSPYPWVLLKEIISFKQWKPQAVSLPTKFWCRDFCFQDQPHFFTFENLSCKLLAGTNFLEEHWQYFLEFYNSKELL